MSRASERGAVAVEFAILAPLLIMLLLGIMEFGRAYNAQIILSNAAREGVRVMAINNTASTARDAGKRAASTLSPELSDTDFKFVASDGTATCSESKLMTVTISYSLKSMTGIAGPFTMTGKGTMLCGG